MSSWQNSSYVMLCQDMLCYVKICYVMSCYILFYQSCSSWLSCLHDKLWLPVQYISIQLSCQLWPLVQYIFYSVTMTVWPTVQYVFPIRLSCQLSLSPLCFSYSVAMSLRPPSPLYLSHSDPYIIHAFQTPMPYMIPVYYVTHDSPLHDTWFHATYDTQSTRPYMINTLLMTPTYNALPIIPV